VAPGGETILLVDDNDSVRTATSAVLRMRGYKVLEAADGQQALETAHLFPDQVHLLITDVVMPKMGGEDLAARLLRERPGIKVIFISGYSEGAIARGGKLTPGSIFVQKPCPMHVLLAKIRELL
jgi:hypothetical protein